MNKSDKNYDRDFQAGDKVFSLRFGNGVVSRMNDSLAPYHVVCDFGKCGFGKTKYRAYTKEGYYKNDDVVRDLYHGHNKKIVVDESVPVREKIRWVYLYVLYGDLEVSVPFETQRECRIHRETRKHENSKTIGKPFKIIM
jgi:hypothetical protein